MRNKLAHYFLYCISKKYRKFHKLVWAYVFIGKHSKQYLKVETHFLLSSVLKTAMKEIGEVKKQQYEQYKELNKDE